MLQQLRDTLIYCDYIAWYYLNTVWRSPLQDAIVPYLRNQWTWAPLYLFLAVLMLYNFGKKGLWWCVGFLLTFAISDFASASLLKPLFHRVRPCNNPFLGRLIHVIVPCGGGYSFPSSHAANHFALAVFMAVTLSGMVRHIWLLGIAWAILVCYAQVYVGVHFPADVLAGGMLGTAAGLLTGKAFRRRVGLTAPERGYLPPM